MSSSVRVLLAEDEPKSFAILKRVLEKNNWIVDNALNGEQALTMFKESPYDVLLTDLSMPKMNGMELVNCIRSEVTVKPVTIMFTGYHDPNIRAQALKLKLDGFFSKPVNFNDLFACIFKGLKRLKKDRETVASSNNIQIPIDPDLVKPSFVGVVIAVSTGGPQTLKVLFDNLTRPFNSSIFLVQHGPGWVLEALVENLNIEYDFPVQLATDGMVPEVDHIYLAPGDRHLKINPETFCLELSNDPPEHFLRPAADPLFRSAARAFGKYCVGVILSGLGKDGVLGAQKICDFGGKILIQDPKAVAVTMPKMAIQEVVKHQVVPLGRMAQMLINNALKMNQQLNGIKELN